MNIMMNIDNVNLIFTIVSIVVTVISIFCSVLSFKSAKKAKQYKTEACMLKDTIDLKSLRRNRQTLWGGCTDANPKLLLNDT